MLGHLEARTLRGRPRPAGFGGRAAEEGISRPSEILPFAARFGDPIRNSGDSVRVPAADAGPFGDPGKPGRQERRVEEINPVYRGVAGPDGSYFRACCNS